MEKFIRLNKKLKSEIDSLIEEHDFLKIISKYGEYFITGSYSYDLMAWRDFDIVLKVDILSNEIIYNLVKDVGNKLNPDRLRVLNNVKKRVNSKRPDGVWIGVYIKGWKIDIWLMNSENYAIEIEKAKLLKAQLKEVDKESLISLKYALSQDPEYHKEFSSYDLYESYLEGNVRNEEDFRKWLDKQTFKDS